MKCGRADYRRYNGRESVRFLFRVMFLLLCIVSILTAFPESAKAEQSRKSELSIRMLPPNIVQLTGDISVNDQILLYCREYRSADHVITDKLLSISAAETDGTTEVLYDPFAVPLTETRLVPDFEYHGREITIKALYAVISDGISEVRSDLVYIECYLDTGVVNQYWCNLAGATA